MRILIDECLNWRLSRALTGHYAVSAQKKGWGGIKNGVLFRLIEREGFDVFLTGDKNMENQQQLEGRPFAVLVMSAITWPVTGRTVRVFLAPLTNPDRARFT